MRVSWLYFLPDTLTYNQEENNAMTPSHITRKKIKPSHSHIYPGKKKPSHSVMALFSSWIYVTV
jgi:hypothetical protein